MRILFSKETFNRRPALGEGIAEQISQEDALEDAAERIEAELRQRVVWAEVFGHDGHKFVVRDVRILEEAIPTSESSKILVCMERLQVLLLEGWQTARRVWTDEPEKADEWADAIPG